MGDAARCVWVCLESRRLLFCFSGLIRPWPPRRYVPGEKAYRPGERGPGGGNGHSKVFAMGMDFRSQSGVALEEAILYL